MTRAGGRKPPVCTIVLNWNGAGDTIRCLESLQKVTYPSNETVIVDNGSTDGSQRLLKERFPEFTLIENSENLGYAGGNNIGVDYGLRRDAAFIVLLNNDTIVDPGFLDPLVEAANRFPRAAFLGPKILYLDAPDVVWFGGGLVDWSKGGIHVGKDQRDDPKDVSPREVDYVTGCCIMARAEAIREIGTMDPAFFLLFEETDWCLRAKKAGWQSVYVPQSRIWHAVSHSFGGQESPTYRYYYARNQLLLIRKHLRGLQRARATVRAFLRELVLAGWYVACGRLPQAGATLRGITHFWLNRFGQL